MYVESGDAKVCPGGFCDDGIILCDCSKDYMEYHEPGCVLHGKLLLNPKVQRAAVLPSPSPCGARLKVVLAAQQPFFTCEDTLSYEINLPELRLGLNLASSL